MSFIVRCPFCKCEMECPDDMLGQVGQCVSCGREIDLEDDRPPVQADAPHSSAISAARAAAIAAMPSEMPRVTFSWAFDFVLKITVAVVLLDGLCAVLIWSFVYLGRMLGSR